MTSNARCCFLSVPQTAFDQARTLAAVPVAFTVSIFLLSDSTFFVRAVFLRSRSLAKSSIEVVTLLSGNNNAAQEEDEDDDESNKGEEEDEEYKEAQEDEDDDEEEDMEQDSNDE